MCACVFGRYAPTHVYYSYLVHINQTRTHTRYKCVCAYESNKNVHTHVDSYLVDMSYSCVNECVLGRYSPTHVYYSYLVHMNQTLTHARSFISSSYESNDHVHMHVDSYLVHILYLCVSVCGKLPFHMNLTTIVGILHI